MSTLVFTTDALLPGQTGRVTITPSDTDPSRPGCRDSVFQPVDPVLGQALPALEVASLFFADGHVEALHDLHHVFPYMALNHPRLVAQQVGRMECGHHWYAPVLLPVAAQTRDAGRHFAEQPLDGGSAQRDHHLGLDDLDLPLDPRETGFHFLGARLAVAVNFAGRVGAALEDVGDVHLVAIQPGGLDDLGQQLAGGTDERFAFFVLVQSRCLADEHQVGVNGADAEDDLCPRRHEVLAQGTGQRLVAQLGHRRFFIGGGQLGRVVNARLVRALRNHLRCHLAKRGGSGFLCGRPGQARQRLRRRIDVAHAPLLERLEVANGGVEQLMVCAGHRRRN